MVKNQTVKLLVAKRFLPFFVCQFLSAFKDNIMRTALVAILTFKTDGLSDLMRTLIVSSSFGLTTLPYLFISATAGELADKYDKSNLIKTIKFFGIICAAIGVVGLFSGSIVVILAAMFLTGIEAALFGPVKYSILPDLLKKDELIAGNGLMEGATFIAILLGIVLGGILVAQDSGSFVLLSAIVMLVTTIAYLTSLYLPVIQAAAPNLKINKNIFKHTLENIAHASRDKFIFKLILGISWFWLAGGIFLAQMPNFTKDGLNSDESVFVLLLSVFTCGTAIGSIICNGILKGKIDIKYSAPALLVASLFIMLIWQTSQYFNNSATMLNLNGFITTAAGVALCVEMFMMAVFIGIFIVPIYAMLQIKAKPAERSRIMAANNIINSLLIVAGSVVSTGLLAVGLSVVSLFFYLAISNLFIVFKLKNLSSHFKVEQAS